MWELGICWEASAILRVPKLEVSCTNPSRQWALTLIGEENSPMESWRCGIPAAVRVTPTLTRSLSISSHAAAAAASRREESSKADRSSSISRSFALPRSVFCLLRRRRQKQTEKRQYRKSIRHSLTLSRFVRQGGKCSTVLEGLNALTDESERARERRRCIVLRSL